MFTISYSYLDAGRRSSAAPPGSLTGVERFAFLPIALSALPLILLAPTIRFAVRGATGRPQGLSA